MILANLDLMEVKIQETGNYLRYLSNYPAGLKPTIFVVHCSTIVAWQTESVIPSSLIVSPNKSAQFPEKDEDLMKI